MQPPEPVSKAAANNTKIRQLRNRTHEMEYELDSNKRLEAETKRYQKTALALYRSNMTPAEKKERDQDTRRMALWASGFCKEAGPDWKDEASATFRNRKL